MIDSELSDGPTLPTRVVCAQVFKPITERLKKTVRAGGAIVLEPDAERDCLLADYRRQFTEQLIHDASYNLQQLWQWANKIDASRAAASRVMDDGQVGDGFRRLDRLRRLLIDTDSWAGDDAERDCCVAFQQFYFDELQLGDRLHRMQGGQRPRFKPGKKLRRLEIPSAASYRVVQALFNAVDVAVPGVAHLRPLRSLLPAAFYIGLRMALPWPAYRAHEYERKLHVILASGALGSLNSSASEVVRLRGFDEFFRDPHFFEPRTGKTRHNISLALSHRQSVYDIAIMAVALRGIDHGVTYLALAGGDYILYERQDLNRGIWAAQLSPGEASIQGKPFRVTDTGQFPSAASDGTLAFLSLGQDQLVRVGRLGRFTGEDVLHPLHGQRHLAAALDLELDGQLVHES